MCGICGIIGLKDKNPIDRMVKSLAHRGPDDQGTVGLDDAVYLGHTRLSIIDLSKVGHQPMTSYDGSVWITYNGEIYNFIELREELRLKGYRFKSNTDTEVILHGYEEWGEGVLDRLNGMFAFAVYDKFKNRLLLARDRLGIKPLYYADYNGHFIFASEIKAILAADLIPREVNRQAVWDYFSFLYIPHPETAYHYIKHLPPAHLLVYDIKKRQTELRRYWHLWEGEPIPMEDRSQAETLLRELVRDAVKRQLVSDVPLGLFLSGGVDSSILACVMAEESRKPVKTFTVVFKGEGIRPHDDRDYARRVSRIFKTDHCEVEVDLSRPEEMLDLISCFDQPFANPTFYISHLISHETRKHVVVALSGAGGDELFGGYPRYRVLPFAAMLGRMPKTFGTLADRVLGFLKEDFDNAARRRMKRLARGIGRDFLEQYLRWTYYFSNEEKRSLLGPMADGMRLEESKRILASRLSASPQGADFYQGVMNLDLNSFLSDNILEYTDRTSMNVSLEARVPFLDHRIVEFACRIPWSYKLREGRAKAILKDAFADQLPADLLDAPKRGFCPPIAAWMAGPLDAYFDRVMTRRDVVKQGIFSWEEIQRLRLQHKARERDNGMELFGILMFNVWHRRYILNEAGRPEF
jgi:asparagine synthase (glutamine-hydrolysing)